MFSYINGILMNKSNNFIVIDVGGVGFKIYMSQTAIQRLGEIGENTKIYIHMHVSENDMSLYGFITDEELRMFELLVSVSGIGSKSAINMLAAISPSSFVLAVITNDITKLVKIPGVGKKTAQRIVLELKDKLDTEEAVNIQETDEDIIKTDNDENIKEAIAALKVLGYGKTEIEKAFEKIDKTNLTVEELIKKGLNLLAR